MRARAFSLVLTFFAAACAASAGGGGGGNTNLLTAAAITEAAISPGEPLYDTIDRVRPQWLRNPEPEVFIDGSNAGGTGALRTVNAGSVQEARYWRAEQASSRFGGIFDGGVIEVTLRE